MSKIIERNTSVPIKQTRHYVTTKENQVRMNIDIREGEREMAKENNLLGNFRLEGIPQGPAGSQQVEITFEIDTFGILNVSAVSKSGNASVQLTIENDKGRL